MKERGNGKKTVSKITHLGNLKILAGKVKGGMGAGEEV